jgi:ribosomal protein L37E
MSNTPAAARILAQQKAMQGNDVVCVRCDSKYFHLVRATIYRAGGYGTVSIQEDTDAQPFDLLVCAGCGYPVSPKPEVGRRAAGIREQAQKEYLNSIAKGQDYLKSLDAQAVTDTVVNASAGKFVEDQVEGLTARLNVVETKLSASEGHKHTQSNRTAVADDTTR